MRLCVFARVLLCFLSLSAWAQDDSFELAQHLVVVYNTNDPQSLTLAEYYAAKRNIPADRVLGISCPAGETVSRKDYQDFIETPVNDYLTRKGWFKRDTRKIVWDNAEYTVEQTSNNPIWCLVLMRGIPLRIAEDADIQAPFYIREELRMNAAAVDSELALLSRLGAPRWGFIPNPFYSAVLFQHFSPTYADWMMLVARLDAPLAEDVRRMIDDAVAVEQTELTGRAYFDSRNITDSASGYFPADEAIRNAAAAARKSGFETSLDTAPAVVPAGTPWDNAALYFGWYTANCEGPFLQENFRFRPGAVAYHIHSFSAATLRSTTQHWAGPLLSKGAAATMGCVYEPYVGLTPNIEIFTNALLNGLSFGEAAYKSQPVLSWMVTMVGDPLYRPYPRQLLKNAAAANAASDPNLPWLLLRLARLVAAQENKPLAERLQQLNALTEKAGAAGYFWEGYAEILQSLQRPSADILAAYQKALANPETAAATIRVTLKQADYYFAQKHPADAFALYETLMMTNLHDATYFNIPQLAQAKAREYHWDNLPPLLAPPPLPAPNREQ